jgi:hypothetical protein
MGMGQSGAAKKQLNQSNQYASGANANAQDLYGALNPMLTAEATNPQGYGAGTLNAMTTGSNQTLGGSVGAAKGEGNLMAARTGNAAGYAPALDQAVQDAGKTQSQNNLQIQTQNANLKNAQQQAGLQGLQGLYGSNLGELQGMMGLGPSTLQAGNQPGTFQQIMGGLGGLAGIGLGAANTASKF